jgi:hypothetical protein
MIALGGWVLFVGMYCVSQWDWSAWGVVSRPLEARS